MGGENDRRSRYRGRRRRDSARGKEKVPVDHSRTKPRGGSEGVGDEAQVLEARASAMGNSSYFYRVAATL